MKIVVFDIGGDALPEVFIGNLGENLSKERNCKKTGKKVEKFDEKV